MNRVLLLAVHPTSVGTIEKTAAQLKRRNHVQPMVLLTSEIMNFRSQIDALNIPVINADTGKVLGPSSQALPGKTDSLSPEKKDSWIALLWRSFWAQWKNLEIRDHWLLAFSFIHLLVWPLQILTMRRTARSLIKILDEQRPQAVYTFTDNLGGRFAIFHRECIKRGITLIRVAAAFYDPTGPASRREKKFVQTHLIRSPWMNLLISRLWPNQAFSYRSKATLFYSPSEILAMLTLGVLPPHPWYQGKSFCDVICVEDFYSKKRFQSWGIPESKIAVTGHIDVDLIHDFKNKISKNDFFEKLGLNPNRPLIVIAAPQFMEHGEVNSWEEHWFENELLVREATRIEKNVLITLHPKSDRKNYQFLEEKYGCKLSPVSTAEALAYADLFISAGSSTCIWAVQNRVATMNMGFYNYGVDVYSYLTSIQVPRSRAEYPQLLAQWFQDGEFRQSLAKKIENDNQYFLPLDGKNKDRICALAENLGHGKI